MDWGWGKGPRLGPPAAEGEEEDTGLDGEEKRREVL
jgi:hypothetical protein